MFDTDGISPGDCMDLCYAHKKNCPVHATRKGTAAGSTIGNFAGFICTEFSSMGKNRGWHGNAAKCFLQWVRDFRLSSADWAICECVQTFKHKSLVDLLGDSYDVRHIIVSPHRLGIPVVRVRKFMFVLKKSALSWKPEVLKESFETSFYNMFGLAPQVPGDVFFRAPADRIEKHLQEAACRRGLPSVRAGGKVWYNRQLLNPGRKIRLKGYEALAVRRGIREERPPYMCNLAQASWYFQTLSFNVPTLLRKSNLWSLRYRREMLAEETLEVQGMSVFSPEDFAYPCPFREAVLNRRFGDGSLRSLSGNAMHIAVVGACLCFLLGGTQCSTS